MKRLLVLLGAAGAGLLAVQKLRSRRAEADLWHEAAREPGDEDLSGT